MPSLDAFTSYCGAAYTVDQRISDLVEKLQEHRNKAEKSQNNWGLVGDLHKVEADLAAILNFLDGE